MGGHYRLGKKWRKEKSRDVEDRRERKMGKIVKVEKKKELNIMTLQCCWPKAREEMESRRSCLQLEENTWQLGLRLMELDPTFKANLREKKRKLWPLCWRKVCSLLSCFIYVLYIYILGFFVYLCHCSFFHIATSSKSPPVRHSSTLSSPLLSS